jgi:TonB family protein
LFSQRVLVALESGQGVIYAPASGWDRVYLLWTFRNFHSLPQTVLNPRQQQLIGSLYRGASQRPAPESDDAVVIGRIEDFNPSSLAARPASKTKADALGQGQPFYARLTHNRVTLKVGAGALVAIIAILAWHKLGAQPVSHWSTSAAVAQPSDIAQAPIVKELAPASLNINAPSDPAGDAGKREPGDMAGKVLTADRHTTAAHQVIMASPSIAESAADQPRIRISGRPQKLVYPVCPGTRVRGKVSLQAVVGYDGAVSRVRVLTGDRVLAAAAVKAVRQWRYEPFPGAAQRQERETDISVSFISHEVVAVSFPNTAALSR